MPLVLPLLSQIAATLFIKSAPIHDSFQAIIDKFNGQIVDADVSGSANLSGAKLADGTIAGAKLADLAVVVAKIANDAVETAKIKDLNVTKAKIAAAAVTLDKLAYTFDSKAFTGSGGDGAWGFVVAGRNDFAQALTGTYPKATHEFIGAYIKNMTVSAGARPVVLLLGDDSGANWAIRAIVDKTNAGVVSGTLITVFVTRT